MLLILYDPYCLFSPSLSQSYSRAMAKSTARSVGDNPTASELRYTVLVWIGRQGCRGKYYLGLMLLARKEILTR